MTPPVQTQMYSLCPGCGRRIAVELFSHPSCHGKGKLGRRCKPKEEKPNGA